MPIVFEQTANALIFRLEGETYVTVKTWKDAIDARVFAHELATGLNPRGFPLDEIWLKIARLAQEQGITISPWYGATQGAYCYTFQFTPDGLRLHCSNGETGDILERVEHSAPSQSPPEADSAVPSFGFPIDGLSYQRLVDWEHWNATDATNARYQYRFVPTTVVGITTVYDTATATEIDVTDDTF